MKTSPILFSGPMVKAILDGSKTQTRRVLKGVRDNHWYRDRSDSVRALAVKWEREIVERECPYGKVGDRLWVRETLIRDRGAPWRYAATGETIQEPDNAPLLRPGGEPTCASIHMPRWACRIELEITEVRVQRLQDLRPDDAISEGITITDEEEPPCCIFAELWDSINEKRGFGWSANPWVWALTFKVVA